MLELGPIAISLADLLRLLAVPVFAWAAWLDIKTRRVSNRYWPPLLALAVLALGIDGWTLYAIGGQVWLQFVFACALSIGLLVPLAYGFWYVGGFGGADAKALMVLAILFPTYPVYIVAGLELPIADPVHWVFSLVILTNAVLVGLIYPVILAARNLISGDLSRWMFVGRPIPVEHLPTRSGRLLETADGFDRNGLDLDALRMYLTWRDLSLAELRATPSEVKHTIPGDTYHPGDGAVTDGGQVDDAWAAETFLASLEGSAYGTDPDQLRKGLEVITTRDRVWFSPGIPFVLLLALGLVLALAYGDIFATALHAVGLG